MTAAQLVQHILTRLCCAGLDFPQRQALYVRVVGHDRISSMTVEELRKLAAEADTIAEERRAKRGAA